MLPALQIYQVRLGFKITRLNQRQFKLPLTIFSQHRNVVPGASRSGDLSRVRLDDFLAQHFRAAQIRAQVSATALRCQRIFACAQGETDAVAHKAPETFSGRWRHDGRQFLHRKVLTQMSEKAILRLRLESRLSHSRDARAHSMNHKSSALSQNQSLSRI